MLVSGAMATPAAASERRTAVGLRDGFQVPRGSRLVGDVFGPYADGGWTAVIEVTTDAVSFMNAFVHQATRLGYGQEEPARCSEIPVSVVGFRCGASYVRGRHNLRIELSVCQQCTPP